MSDLDLSEELNRTVAEMKALISFCEVTDNQEMRMMAKRRLITLSAIPAFNEWSIKNLHLNKTVNEVKPVLDHSSRFNDLQVKMIKFYLANPNKSLNKIGSEFGITENSSAHFISRFFKYSQAERDLILNKNSNL